jgi:ATP-dependent DNA helicase RecQ
MATYDFDLPAGDELPHDPLTDAAADHFSISYLFPYQRLVISNILRASGVEGFAPKVFINPVTGEEDTLDTTPHQIVILPTGAGKSLCFMLPARMLAGPTLVI